VPELVAENRDRLAADLGDQVTSWVWLHQVHGDAIAVADDLRHASPGTPPEADAAVTTVAGTAVCVLAADCAPIALVGDRAVAVVHAGWLGLEAGVIGRAVGALRRHDPSPGGPVRAVLGPCIRPGRYEFGPTDLARLVGRFGPTVAATTEWDTPAFDLPEAVRLELAAAGVDDVLDLDVCTSVSPDHFSHRRDGVTGRQAVVAVLEP